MILWIILFLLVVALSFVLAAKSMRDFEEIPEEIEKYNSYLVRLPQQVNKKLLDSIYEDSLSSGLAFSFERLIKGEKGALVFYAPAILAPKYQEVLGLVEIEEYTNCDMNLVSSWEALGKGKNYFKKFPKLDELEQFWWQLILLGRKENMFQVQIRAVLISQDPLRRRKLTEILEERDQLNKLPKASNTQTVGAYQKRSFTKDTSSLLASKDILHLLTI